MATSSDFTQKLLNDLRLRKERMAAAQKSSHSSIVLAGAYGNSRQNLMGSKDTKTLDLVSSKMGNSTYKGSGGSKQRSLMSQSSNQMIVPYGKSESSEPTIDLSRALAYAFGNGGEGRTRNKMEFSASDAVLGFLQQIGSSVKWTNMERMRRGSNMQWAPSDRYPNLTNLHINEISKGAQKLNEILKACSKGVNIDRRSVEIGKELLKGAMDLEESLRMLVNLQEASEYKVGKQKKSQIKLLEEDDDVDGRSGATTENKHVERPVFSFDKNSHQKKGTLTGNKEQFLALTYTNEAGNIKKPEKQVMNANHNSHRRTASCQADFDVFPVVSAPHRVDSSQPKTVSKAPSVIAKLMGLEEPPSKANRLKVNADKQTTSNQKLDGLLSTRTPNRIDTDAELKRKDMNYMILGASKKEMQNNQPVLPALNCTGIKQINVANGTKIRRSYEEIAKKTQESTLKVSELRRFLHQNKAGGSPPKINRTQADENDEREREYLKMNYMQKTAQATYQSSEAAQGLRGETSGNENSHPRVKRNTSKLPPKSIQQQQEKDAKLQQSYLASDDQPQGKKQKSEERPQLVQPMSNHNRTQIMQTKEQGAQAKKSKKVAHGLKIIQKCQPNRKQGNNSQQANGYVAPLESPMNMQYKERACNQSPSSSDRKLEAQMKAGSENHGARTDQEIKSQVQKATKNLNLEKNNSVQSAALKSIMDDQISPNSGITQAAKEEMARKTRAPNKTPRSKNHKITLLQGLKSKQLEKIGNSQGVIEATIRKTMPTKIGSNRMNNGEHGAKQINESSQKQIKIKHASITYKAEKDASPNLDEHDTTPSSNSEQPSEASPCRDLNPQKTALGQAEDLKEDKAELSYTVNETQQQILPKNNVLEPLTEDEVQLKQALITSHLFLNTAEALFKLNIPITILNAIDHVGQEKENKILIDTGYEVLKRKARRQELCLDSCMKISNKGSRVLSLDDLVKKLHKDFQILRCYGRNGKNGCEHDSADYLINMLERDVHYWYPDANCMWDLEWRDSMFAHVEVDEVIRDVEKSLLNELLDDVMENIVQI